jgi:hypothetical protein
MWKVRMWEDPPWGIMIGEECGAISVTVTLAVISGLCSFRRTKGDLSRIRYTFFLHRREIVDIFRKRR